MNKNKIIVYLTALMVAFGYNSCDEDNVDLDPTGVTEQAYFSEEIEFERAVFGAYAKLSDFYWYNASQFNCVQPVTLLPGDDVTTTAQEEFEDFAGLNPGSGRIAYFYTAIYQLIARSNVVLEKNEQVAAGIYKTAGLKEAHRGEALFLRAYGHYLLWNLFGTAPVRTQRLASLADAKPGSSTGTALLDQAITDLTEAATLLPSSWSDINRGRITANAANGLLGKCLVFRATVSASNADYTAAIAAFDKISGVSLVPQFDDNFAADTENNAESLFEFQASQAFGGDNPWLPNDFDNPIGALSVFWGFYDGHWSLFGKAPFIATQKLANMYEPDDPRKSLTLNAGNLAIRKYVTRDRLNQPGQSSVNNPRILRLADVLLLKAEALVESGGATAQAIDLINQVRARARGAGVSPANRDNTVSDRAVIRQWIMDERLMELAGEGQRWFDLRRWALGGKLSLNNDFFSSANPGQMAFSAPKHLNFPIPTVETDVNPNITQNTGY
ncbi:MAG: RagB/SusD family nutrient uptake outer membrane protein [Bacteroidota bacterium]